ncbi:MAG: PPC domain-containing DNA-binding protein [Cuniculiplasma sp.]
MQHRREGNFVIIKLDDGEDIIKSLELILERESISNGFIVSGIGAGIELEIGYLRDKVYEKEIFGAPMEITSLSGSVTQGNPRMHIHINAAGADHVTRGGHLFSGQVKPLMEILVLSLDSIKMTRELKESSGMREIKFL